MTTCVALIRGIGPTNPNMKSDKLKSAFESLGFKNVATVIASGNVVFESTSSDMETLETKIEKGLSKKLSFERAVLVRSRAEIERLVARDPFKGIKDEKPNYLLITFFKDRRRELASVLDMTDGPTEATSHMARVEREHGKTLTSRTWKTVNRILKKMSEASRQG
ncbi:MAG: DUF1697 domain-containing protein [Patescibacteria group bacterium]|nr:DUF1697 domain-containing protein [Patescibacteria group bacterium]MDE2116266.1 DUF1697 domain-containing protein [Patescibacteria group bacterium]